MVSRGVLDAVEKRRMSSPCAESNYDSSHFQHVSQSCRLSYPSSEVDWKVGFGVSYGDDYEEYGVLGYNAV
jgi:hypothetical protein